MLWRVREFAPGQIESVVNQLSSVQHWNHLQVFKTQRHLSRNYSV